MKIAAVVLAGGYGSFRGPKGKEVSKVTAHLPNGKPMLRHLVETLISTELFNKYYVVINTKYGDQIQQVLNGLGNINFPVQPHRLGSAGAVKLAVDMMGSEEKHTGVFYGDMPLLSRSTIQKVAERHLAGDNPKLTVLSIPRIDGTPVEDYGRIMVDSEGNLVGTIDDPDYVQQEDFAEAKRVNPSVYTVDVNWFTKIFPGIREYKKPHEDPLWPPPEKQMQSAIKIAYTQGQKIAHVPSEDHEEVYGVNKLHELRRVREVFRNRCRHFNPKQSLAA